MKTQSEEQAGFLFPRGNFGPPFSHMSEEARRPASSSYISNFLTSDTIIKFYVFNAVIVQGILIVCTI